MKKYWNKNCPICNQGRLIVKIVDKKYLCLICEECFSLFESPEDSQDGNNGKEGMDIKGVAANREEIERYGWAKYNFRESEDV